MMLMDNRKQRKRTRRGQGPFHLLHQTKGFFCCLVPPATKAAGTVGFFYHRDRHHSAVTVVVVVAANIIKIAKKSCTTVQAANWLPTTTTF